MGRRRLVRRAGLTGSAPMWMNVDLALMTAIPTRPAVTHMVPMNVNVNGGTSVTANPCAIKRE